jgi:maleylacetate reductase
MTRGAVAIRLLLMSASAAPRVDYGGLAVLPGLLAAAQRRRVLVLSGPGSRHVERVTALLEGLDWEVFSEARRHVPRELVATASERLRAFAADAVVSIGGGSATGLGKALRLEHAFFFVAHP